MVENSFRTEIQWDPTGLAVHAANGGFKIATDKLPMVVTAGMGGIAADEVFNDLPRSANHNFDIRLTGSDGNKNYRYLIAEGMTHEEAMEFMHKKIDENVEYLKQHGVASVIRENVGPRKRSVTPISRQPGTPQ